MEEGVLMNSLRGQNTKSTLLFDVILSMRIYAVIAKKVTVCLTATGFVAVLFKGLAQKMLDNAKPKENSYFWW